MTICRAPPRRAPASDPQPSSAAPDEEEEDDYMNMTFAEAPAPQKETLTQARKRKLLHAETAGRPKSKAELAAEEARRREEGLAKRIGGIDDNGVENKGLRMMQKLGYKPGTALGVRRDGDGEARIDPISLAMKEDRSGIGRESEAKRKFREEAEKMAVGEKRRKIEQEEFVERVREERENKRTEGLVIGAQKVAERLEEESLNDGEKKRRKLKGINILWRSLVKQREISERDKRMRHEVYTSLGTRPEYQDDEEEDRDDKLAMGKKADVFEVDDTELDEEDPELEEFEASEPKEKLEKLVQLLRETWRYCFWCKYRYEDETMEGCPGPTEEDHD